MLLQSSVKDRECLKNKKKLNLEDSEIDILISAYKQLEFLKLNKSVPIDRP